MAIGTLRNGTERNETERGAPCGGNKKKSNLNSKNQYNHNSKLHEPCIIIFEWCIMSDETHNTQNIKYEPYFVSTFVSLRKVPLPTWVLVFCETERNKNEKGLDISICS